MRKCLCGNELTPSAPLLQIQRWQHQVAVLIPLNDKRGKASMMFNQLRRGQECSPLAREQNSWHKWSLLPPFWSGTHWELRARRLLESSPPVSQTGLTWRVNPSLLSQRRRPCPKKQNLCSLNCWVGTKGGSSLPRCLSLFTVLFVNDTIDVERLWFLSWRNKAHFPCSHVANLIKKSGFEMAWNS